MDEYGYHDGQKRAQEEMSVMSMEEETDALNKQNNPEDGFEVIGSSPDEPEDNSEIEVISRETSTQVVDDPETDARIMEQRKNILQCAKLLKISKTAFNSKEYTELIALMEKIGEGKTALREDMSRKEQFAQELYAIHLQTEAYLEHKAKDGVKRNSYRKLLAVSKTNDMLQSCIENLGGVKFRTPSGQKDLTDLPISLTARKMSTMSDVKLDADYMGRARALKAKDKSLSGISDTILSDCILSVDTCMCEIIIKAEKHNNAPAMNALKALRESFLTNPLPPSQDEPEKTAKSKVNEKGAMR